MTQPLLFEPLPARSGEASWFCEVLLGLGVADGPGWPDRFGAALRQHFASQRRVRTLSLFAGGGGLDLAFHDAGFEVVEMVEIEPKYALTLARNAEPAGLLAGSRVVCGDIRDYQPDSALNIEFIIGGPPCQTFSAAGRRAAGVAGTSDARGTLFAEYVRVLRTLQPRGFLFENVYGLTGAQNGEAWADIQAAFRDAGYVIHSRILDAADYGVPQHRERLFIVGLRADQDRPFLFPFPTHGPDSPGQQPYYTAGQAVAGADTQGAASGLGGRYGALLNDIPPGLNYSFYTQELGHPFPVFSWRSKFSDFLYKADPDAPMRTLKAQGGQYTGPFSWENRLFTLAELKRLQTFPDAYELSGKQQAGIQQLGNSVPPQLGRMLALAIQEQLMGAALPFSLRVLPSDHELGFRQRKRALTKHYATRANAALAVLAAEGRLHPTRSEVYVTGTVQRVLGPDFAWTGGSAGTPIELEYALEGTDWHILARCSGSAPVHTYHLNLRPAPGSSWGLEGARVRLSALDDRPETFTALWKAFEERLHAVTGNADLVQLSGYYQYAPRVRITLEDVGGLPALGLILAQVVRGNGVAAQLQVRQFAYLWACPAEAVLPALRQLRRLGYEVRSHHTNPQIPSGEYLIPYAFPTLTPRSVQLRKSLEGAPAPEEVSDV